MKMYLTRNKRSNKLILHFDKPRCLNNQAWVSDDREIQLNDAEYDVTFENSPMEVELKLIK
jgi:hypothetical protein